MVTNKTVTGIFALIDSTQRPVGYDTMIGDCSIISIVLHTQILKQSVLKPASPRIPLNHVVSVTAGIP